MSVSKRKLSDSKMVAKARITQITPYPEEGTATQETVLLHGVPASQYPEDGSDENNTFAKYSPSFEVRLTVANPNLLGKFKIGETFYVDFIPAPDEK